MNTVKQLLIKSLRGTLSILEESEPGDTTAGQPEEWLQLGDVLIDFQAHQVCRDGKTFPLTPSEYKILIALAAHEGETMDYASLVQLGLGYETDPIEAKELMKRHIFTLRQKIGPDFRTPRYILNVRGYGYRLVSAPVISN